tara:strand:+ start:4415 stop:5752 length:1338 start_codon:yes stop_codon:yes gene_type:complete
METFSIMPHNDDLEKSVLGCIFQDSKCFDKISPYLNKSEDIWYITKHQRLWQIMKEIKAKGEPVDFVTVNAYINTQDKEKYDLDAYYITGLPEYVATTGNAESYAKQLYETYLLRKTVKMMHKIQDKASKGDHQVWDIMTVAQQSLEELIVLQPSKGFDMVEVTRKALEEIREYNDNIIKTGYRTIDKWSGGFTKGEISIVGGRPGHGKTTFLINLVSNLVGSGHRVLLFNRELPNTEVAKKLLVLESGNLSYRTVRTGVYDKTEEEEIVKASEFLIEKYASDKFLMFDKIRDFRQSEVEVRKFQPDVVIDDYIQLIKPSVNVEQRRLQLESICMDYKWLAKTSNCAVILASQLNRALEMRGKDTEPNLSDLAESGAIEQVAENVWFTFYQHKVYPNRQTAHPNKIKLVAKKVRYGETGDTVLGYDGDKCKIYTSFNEYKKVNQK